MATTESPQPSQKLVVDKKEVYNTQGGTRHMKSMCDRLARAGVAVLVQTGTDLSQEYARAGRAWGNSPYSSSGCSSHG